MLIQLIHLKSLKYTKLSKKFVNLVPEDIIALAKQPGSMILTFRPLPSNVKPDKKIYDISAIERFSWVQSENVVLYGLETDTPLAPLILWDIAHSAKIGSTITLIGDAQINSYLQRSYFEFAFDMIEDSPDKRVFRKRDTLAAENDQGLDAWTFCIPTGPEDATLLNITVQRILELDIPEKEILLCGRPGANFAYFDKVRIVGEDITAPPVKICAKKNRLAQEASHPNLCIIHDRVFLSLDFYTAVKTFGDNYPLTTFQSIFFDDKYNFIPRRYSDIGVSYKARATSSKGLMRDNDANNLSIFAPGVLPITELSGFYAANIRRYVPDMYPTGSLYLCKRSVWLAHPQNENLHWIEFEDLEHAFRASDSGVPSRVNPYALTQSLISRPLLGRVSGSYMEPISGPPSLIRSWSEWLPLPRKPAIKATKDTALLNLHRFAEKYVPKGMNINIPASSVTRSVERVRVIINILSRVQLPLREGIIRDFLHDYEKLVIMDQLPFSQIEHICYRLLIERSSLVQTLVLDNDILRNHLAIRPKGEIFCTSMSDYIQSNSFLLKLGTIISALYLYFRRKSIIYLKGSPLFYVKAILNTTPFGR